MKYIKYLFLLLLLFPLTVFAEDSITISNLTLVNKEGLAVELNPATINGTTISLDTKMYEVGDSIEYQFTIENNTRTEYLIDIGNLNNDYVHYQLNSENGTTLKPSSTNTYTLTATYQNEVPQDGFKGGKFEVGVDQLLELKDPSLINPLTGNFFYMFILLIIAVCIIFGLKLKYKRTVITIILIGMFIIPYYTHATEIIHLDFGLKIGNILPTYCTYDGEVSYGTEYVNGQFTYYYGKEYLYSNITWSFEWDDIGDGWSVLLTDKYSYDPVTSTLCTYINDIPIISTSMMFRDAHARSIDTSSYNTSHIKNMSYMFNYSTNITSLDLSNFDTSNVLYTRYMFDTCSIPSLNLSGFDTSNIVDMSYMFRSASRLTSLDLSTWDTSHVEKMTCLFSGCSSLTNLNISSFDTSNATSIGGMFSGCEHLNSIDVSNFDTSNVVDLSGMFRDCLSLVRIDLSGFDTSNVIYLSSMFSECSSLLYVDMSNFNTSKVESLAYMFNNCTSLETLDLSGFDTSSVAEMHYMFAGCSSLSTLNISSFDTSHVTNMYSMFEGCGSLTSLDLSNFDTSSTRYMEKMFYDCSSLTSIVLNSFDTANVTGMYAIFKGCTSLTIIDISSFDMSKVSNYSTGYMFDNCTSLNTVYVRSQDEVDKINSYSYKPASVEVLIKSV